MKLIFKTISKHGNIYLKSKRCFGSAYSPEFDVGHSCYLWEMGGPKLPQNRVVQID